MKKTVLFIAITLFTFNGFAQVKLGGGISFWSETALEAKANFGLSEQIDLSGTIDYFLVDNVSLILLGVDGHYNFEVGDGFKIYPMAGLNLVSASAGGVSVSQFYLGLGGGAIYDISDSVSLYGEVKHLLADVSDTGISLGVMFSLGN